MPNMPTRAVAPLLRGQPGDHLDQVGLLLGRVLVGRVARRRAGAAHVDAADGVPEPVAQVLVARRRTTTSGRPCGRAVPRAGRAAGRRPGREVERGRELDAVAHRDPDLGSACLQQRQDLGGVQRLAGVAAATDGGGCGEHRVQHRLLGRLDDGGEERVERRGRSAARAVGPPGRGRAAARCRSRGRSRRCRGGRPTRRGPARARSGGPAARRTAPSTGASVTTTPRQEPAGFAGCRTAAGGSSRPTGVPATTSSSRTPKFVSSRTATVWPVGGHPRRRTDAALEAQAGHAGPGADRALVRRCRRAAGRERGGVRGAYVVGGHVHPAAVVEEGVVALADDRDHHVVGDARRRARARSRRPRRRPGRAASSRSGRRASRPRPTRARSGSRCTRRRR